MSPTIQKMTLKAIVADLEPDDLARQQYDQLISAFADLEAQVKQASVTAREIRSILRDILQFKRKPRPDQSGTPGEAAYVLTEEYDFLREALNDPVVNDILDERAHWELSAQLRRASAGTSSRSYATDPVEREAELSAWKSVDGE
jgi:hypothetical protein